MELTPADLSTYEVGGRKFTNIRIAEVGRFSVPEQLLREAPLFPRVFDVLSLGIGTGAGRYVLEARGSIVTAELMSANIRLEIYPKFGFEGLAALLALSSQSITTLEQKTPVNVEEGQGLVEVFARRFLAAMQPLASSGWIPVVGQVEIVASDIRGQVEVLSSYRRILGGQLSFHQRINRRGWDHPANRVIFSALAYLHALRELLPGDVVDEVAEHLASAPLVRSFPRGPREALARCEDILASRSLDAARSYFYPACEAARPILQALGRALGGVPRVEDVPFRIEMPSTVESAVRNMTSRALGTTFTAVKEDGAQLYERSAPAAFNPTLTPDIVVRPVRDPRRCAAVIDVKYKERATAGDHYQLAAYARAYGTHRSAFVTVTDDPGPGGEVARAVLPDGGEAYEYAVPAHDVTGGLARYGRWVEALCGSRP